MNKGCGKGSTVTSDGHLQRVGDLGLGFQK